jgi:hypothetical protein
MANSHLKLVAPSTENRAVTPHRRPNAKLRTREYLSLSTFVGTRSTSTVPPWPSGGSRKARRARILSAAMSYGRFACRPCRSDAEVDVSRVLVADARGPATPDLPAANMGWRSTSPRVPTPSPCIAPTMYSCNRRRWRRSAPTSGGRRENGDHTVEPWPARSPGVSPPPKLSNEACASQPRSNCCH